VTFISEEALVASSVLAGFDELVARGLSKGGVSWGITLTGVIVGEVSVSGTMIAGVIDEDSFVLRVSA
jgi:hypothetical protein